MPKIVDHEQKREELVRVILNVISEQGLNGATLRAIAKKGGFSSGVLVHYFSNKEEMIAFAFSAFLDEVFSRIENKLPKAPSKRHKVKIILEEFLPQSDDIFTNKLTILFWSEALHNDVLRNNLNKQYARWRSMLMSILISNDVRDRRTVGKLEDAIDAIIAMSDGLLIGETFSPERFSARRRNKMIDMALGFLDFEETMA